MAAEVQLEVGTRTVCMGRPTPGVSYCDNSITTSKYTALNFIPKSLMYQFRRFANLWFLFQTIVMVAGEYTNLFATPFSPWSMLAMLVIVLGIVMVFEARDDLFRHQQDSEVNNRSATVLLRGEDANPDLGTTPYNNTRQSSRASHRQSGMDSTNFQPVPSQIDYQSSLDPSTVRSLLSMFLSDMMQELTRGYKEQLADDVA